MENEDENVSGDTSKEHITVSDVSAVEAVCKDLGFVMCANQCARCVNGFTVYC